MSSALRLNIEHVAKLARLALTSAEQEEYARQLGEVLHHIQQLEKLDVVAVEPTAHAFPIHNVWAEDEPQPGLPVAAVLRNAPAQRNNMIAVPKVVE